MNSDMPPENVPTLRKEKVYSVLANLVQAYHGCLESSNTEWGPKHMARIQEIVDNSLPSGSGIDGGTKIDLDKSTESKLILYCSYHHMDENGFYNGWTDHAIIVTPSLISGIELRITGWNRGDIKDYLHDCYYWSLKEEIDF